MTFTYWTREIAGWALILAGLYFFWESYSLLLNKRVFEAAPLSFIGFVVFRGGIHVLKVAVAAQAARKLTATAAVVPRRLASASARPVGPTPAERVVPGRKPARTGTDGRS